MREEKEEGEEKEDKELMKRNVEEGRLRGRQRI